MSQLNTIKILLVEDDEIDFFIFNNYIREIGDERLSVDWCDDYTRALFKMADEEYDLYFVDYRLGESTALQLLDEMKKFGFTKPVVVLTGKGSRNIDIQAMERGAVDYLIKADLNAEKLDRCIRYALDRAKALAAIKERENKYRSLFEKSADAICIADRFLFMREVNTACCELFEANEDSLTTHNLYHFLKDGKTGQTLYQSIENNEPVNNLEIVIKTDKEKTRNCLLTVSPIEYDSEVMFHCILRDITELRKAENVNMQLEKMEATEKLIRMLGHEIRNPLTNIGLAADGLIQQMHEDEFKLLLGIIQRNTNRINQLIGELIDSTRSSTFHFELASLQDILDETLASSSDRIGLRKININKIYPQKPCYIMADRKKMKIALSNFIINAAEAMKIDEGQLTIEISGNNELSELIIKDNGHGIPKEFLPKLFDPFSTMKPNGLGLGLSTAYNILKIHQANVEVESELGTGTTFKIRFSQQLTLLNQNADASYIEKDIFQQTEK